MAASAHYTITEISPTGEPLEPIKVAKKFVKQCGVMVRDRVPITVREWNKPKGVEDNEYVAERYKDGLWNDLMAHFTLPECEEEDDTAALRDKVKVFTLKKMAELFRQWKKTLWQEYQKTNSAPKFEGYLVKQKAYWDAFVKYKKSEDATEKLARAKKNAAEKKYHHKLGTGGYATAMPKWDKIEEALLAKGIIPEPIRDEWEQRARNFFLAHGSEYDNETGDLVCNEGIRVPRETWLKVVKEIKEGKTKFRADREKDLLTKVLGNPEKGGRTRGFGPSYP